LAKKKETQVDPLLPTVSEPGTYAWCEEVVDCMNSAWAMREQGEQGFLAAVRAALASRIWETLSPPPPQDPYTSFANLVRRTAPPGQAEAMQLVIKFSGLEEGSSEGPWAVASGGPRAGVSAPWDDPALAGEGMEGEDPEVALGRKLLEAFEAQAGGNSLMGGNVGEVSLPADYGQGPAAETRAAVGAGARVTAAQRKREKLAQAHPDLLDAVQAGEMTLKQAYVEAGIEKPPQLLDKLQKLWRNASEEEQERFANWVQEQVQKAKKAAYEAEVYGEG
jgi:hypothetical protein